MPFLSSLELPSQHGYASAVILIIIIIFVECPFPLKALYNNKNGGLKHDDRIKYM